MKNIPKIITILFLIIFILQLAGLMFLLLTPNATNAADDPIPFTPQVSIPDSDFIAGTPYGDDGKTTRPIAEYISAIYNYSVAVVGILAVAVLVFAGIKWIIAGGSPEKLTDAKAWIGAAITGLVLVMVSYMLLTMINPRLTNFQILSVQKAENNKTNITSDDSLSCGEHNSSLNICGTNCPENEACKLVSHTSPGAKECPKTLNGSGNYWSCMPTGEGSVCNKDTDCADGLICDTKRCKYPKPTEGQDCLNGECANDYYCYNYHPYAGLKGTCYDGSLDDLCLKSDQCIQNRCVKINCYNDCINDGRDRFDCLSDCKAENLSWPFGCDDALKNCKCY